MAGLSQPVITGLYRVITSSDVRLCDELSAELVAIDEPCDDIVRQVLFNVADVVTRGGQLVASIGGEGARGNVSGNRNETGSPALRGVF